MTTGCGSIVRSMMCAITGTRVARFDIRSRRATKRQRTPPNAAELAQRRKGRSLGAERKPEPRRTRTNEPQFIDAVAIGLISPGPVVIMATFAGYLVGGIAGAAIATLAVCLPG